MKQSAFKSKLSKILKEKYLNEWYSAKQAYSVGKLDTYTKIKNHFGFEKYLNSLSFAYRRDITRLRISSHRLSIEIGRYARIDRTDCLCSKCTLGVLGDEIYFLLECPAFNVTRESLIRLVNEKFMAMIRFDKYFWLVNSEDERIMQELASFVHTNLDFSFSPPGVCLLF